jgi:hypothetical protein
MTLIAKAKLAWAGLMWLLLESKDAFQDAVSDTQEEIEDHVEHNLRLYIEHDVHTRIVWDVKTQVEPVIQQIVEKKTANLLTEIRLLKGKIDSLQDTVIRLEREVVKRERLET